MRYGDFSSLVQLGVGLHLGTALLQLYGEFGVQPLARSISRTKSLFSGIDDDRPSKTIEEELDRLENKFEIFRIRLFHEYKKYILINSIVAALLAVILVLISIFSGYEISYGMEWTVVLMIFLSLFPAPITLGALWFDAGRLIGPMKKEADELETRALTRDRSFGNRV